LVAVIGGSSAATMAAVLLSSIAKKVYIIYRGNDLRGDPTWKKQALSKDNIEVLYKSVVTGLLGEEKLESVRLNRDYNGSNILPVDGLFVEIGSEPNQDLPYKIGVDLTKEGYIKVDQAQRTNIEGIWAAGDCTTNSNRLEQVVTAAAEGAIASDDIYRYLNK
jgi:thioredoxin reductase (NADPH)